MYDFHPRLRHIRPLKKQHSVIVFKWKSKARHFYLKIYFTIFCAAKCIDHYTQQRVKIYEGITLDGGKEIVIDPKLEAVVNRMFQRCFDDGKYKQVNFK